MNENLDSKNILGQQRSYKDAKFELKNGTLIHLTNRPSLMGLWFLEVNVYDSRDFFKVTYPVIFNVPLSRITKVIKFLIVCAEKNHFGTDDKARVQKLLNGWK